MKTPIGICTCGNNKLQGNARQLIFERSEEQIEKILSSKLLSKKIPTPLQENILKSVKSKDPILLDAVGKDYLQPLNELAVMLSAKWSKREITVKFLHRSVYLEPWIKEYAKEWEKYANIEFVFIEKGNADVRISFFQDGTSWSMLGNESLLTTDQTVPTINFGWFNNNTDLAEIRRTTLHEFGHVLGCIHEHQSPDGNIPWDEAAIRRVYVAGYKYSEEWVQRNILEKFPTSDISNSTYDQDSIMHYPFDAMFTKTGKPYGVNWNLSEQDKKFIKACYPF